MGSSRYKQHINKKNNSFLLNIISCVGIPQNSCRPCIGRKPINLYIFYLRVL